MRLLGKALMVAGVVATLFALQDGRYFCLAKKVDYGDGASIKLSIKEAIKKGFGVNFTKKGNKIISTDITLDYYMSYKDKIDIYTDKNETYVMYVPSGNVDDVPLVQLSRFYKDGSKMDIILYCIRKDK